MNAKLGVIRKATSLYFQTNELKKQVRKSEPASSAMKREIEAKNRELEALRGELAEVWERHRGASDTAAEQAALIRQLQALQRDTQASEWAMCFCTDVTVYRLILQLLWL